ncbi:hypothetical protein R6Q59_033572 [Mikania micrantha]
MRRSRSPVMQRRSSTDHICRRKGGPNIWFARVVMNDRRGGWPTSGEERREGGDREEEVRKTLEVVGSCLLQEEDGKTFFNEMSCKKQTDLRASTSARDQCGVDKRGHEDIF